MADESTQLIVGDAAADALGERRKRRFFRRRRKPEDKLTKCENCETPLAGEYCFVCGQHAIDYRRSLARVALDAADSFFNWDTKFLKTIGVLLTRPGKLTNDFNAGRRARYVHPLRLYLLASIAFFLIAQLLNFTDFKDNSAPELTPQDRAEMDGAIAKLSAPDSPLAPEQRARIDAARARWSAPDILETEKRAVFDTAMLRLSRVAAKKELKPEDIARIERALGRMEAADRKGKEVSAEEPPAPDAPPGTASPSPPLNARDSEPKSSFEVWIENRIRERVGEDGTKWGLFLSELRRHVPTMMLCCVPIFAFVLKILYVRQRRYYVEHLVYALHIHTFAYIAVVVIALAAMGTVRVLPGLAELLAPLLVIGLSCLAAVQVFLSVRRVYGQGWFMTVFKFLLGSAIYAAAIVCALAATAIITLALPG